MPQPLRPMPNDFREVAARLKYVKCVAKHYAAGQTTVERWFREAGIKPGKRQVHELPADFAERAKTMHGFALSQHYGVAPKVVRRWADEAGVTLIKGRVIPPAKGRVIPPAKRRECPADFAQMAAFLTYTGLCNHYNTGRSAVDRWVSETGATPLVFVRKPSEAKPQAGKPSRGLYHAIGISSNIAAAAKPYTAHDRAADTIRPYAAVYRCDERGKADLAGKFWRVGMVVVTPDELLERAARYERRAA